MADQFPIVQPQAGLPTDARQKLFDSMSGEAYTGYVSLIQSSADLAKPPHRMPMGTWALVENKQPISLGEKFDAVIIDFRPLARVVDKRGAQVKITSVCNPEDPRFADIQRTADMGKQEGSLINYWGFEYLLWLPSLGKFATYYANGKTSRRAAKESIHPLMSDLSTQDIKVVEFGSQFIQTAAYSWFGPTCEEVQVELEAVPDPAQFQRVYDTFIAATTALEAMEEVATDATDSDR